MAFERYIPEEIDIDTDRLQDQINEKRAEARAERREGARPFWLDALAVSTALFAVVAALAALEAGDHANEALYKANQAVLLQTKAVDTWNEFEADSVKRNEAQNLQVVLGHVGGTPDELQAAQQGVTDRQQGAGPAATPGGAAVSADGRVECRSRSAARPAPALRGVGDAVSGRDRAGGHCRAAAHPGGVVGQPRRRRHRPAVLRERLHADRLAAYQSR